MCSAVVCEGSGRRLELWRPRPQPAWISQGSVLIKALRCPGTSQWCRRSHLSSGLGGRWPQRVLEPDPRQRADVLGRHCGGASIRHVLDGHSSIVDVGLQGAATGLPSVRQYRIVSLPVRVLKRYFEVAKPHFELYCAPAGNLHHVCMVQQRLQTVI